MNKFSVICIKVDDLYQSYGLTLGQSYKAVDITGGYYAISCPTPAANPYPKKYFKRLDEIREEKLNELGI